MDGKWKAIRPETNSYQKHKAPRSYTVLPNYKHLLILGFAIIHTAAIP